MAEHNLKLQFNMNDLGENDRDERECAEADENEHGKEESKKTAMESKALSQDLCSVQADLSRYQKRQSCTKFEGGKSAKKVEFCDYGGM